MSALAWIGRQRARALAALILIGILTPLLGAVLRPYVGEAVFVLLVLSFLRTDLRALVGLARRPGLVLAAALWSCIAMPALAILAMAGYGRDAIGDGLYLALVLQAVTSPMMASPALARLMGLNGDLALAVLILTSMLTPLTAPVLTSLSGADLPLSGMALGLMLAGMLAASAALGVGLRQALGAPAIARHGETLDGVNILVLMVFVSSVMGEVGLEFLKAPLTVLGLTALAFAANASLIVLTSLAFILWGKRNAAAIGLMSSQRNVGLMLAVAGPLAPPDVWLYFAVSQIPIYLAPVLLQPLLRIWLAPGAWRV